MLAYQGVHVVVRKALRGVFEEECFRQVLSPGENIGKTFSRLVYRGCVRENRWLLGRTLSMTLLVGTNGNSQRAADNRSRNKAVHNILYEMHCNWKVFYENAIDGYHLGYLHDQTLGKVYPSQNIWVDAGRNVVWYSTERDGPPQSVPLLSEQLAQALARRALRGMKPPSTRVW